MNCGTFYRDCGVGETSLRQNEVPWLRLDTGPLGQVLKAVA